MKKSEFISTVVLVPLDFLMIILAGLAAYFLRFGSDLRELWPVIYKIPFPEYLSFSLLVALGWLLIFSLSGLYKMKRSRRLIDEFSKIFLACSTGIMAVILIFFFKRELIGSRFIILVAWILAISFVFLARGMIRLVQYHLFRKGKGLEKIILIGQDKTTEEIARLIYRSRKSGYEIIHRVRDASGNLFQELEEILKKKEVDGIIQADPNFPREITNQLLSFSHIHHLSFRYAADIFATKASNLDIDASLGVPIIEIKKTPLEGWGRVIKRTIDVLGAFLGLIFFSPLFLIIALLIKIDSQGSVFVRLPRIGAKGKKFILYKFRSMIKNAHLFKKDLLPYNIRKDGPLFKIKNDPRITRIGRFLRKWSIDEFPQFLNVLKGEMSLIGPRPHEPEEVAQYKRHERELLTLKPGITGLAQISGRSDLSFEDEARLDIYYIENWSLKLDFYILFKTPWVVLSRKSAC